LIEDKMGASVPRVDLVLARRIFRALHGAIRSGLVRACHDLSEGGLGVAVAEMTFGSALGLELGLGRVPCAEPGLSPETLLWSESPSRFLVEVTVDDVESFEDWFRDLPAACVGRVLEQELVRIIGLTGEQLLAEPVTSLKAVWQQAGLAREGLA
jgi:phosphoribosylformylglycinamidine synthase